MIRLQRENIVKEVSSEVEASRLTANGYRRLGGTAETVIENNPMEGLIENVKEVLRQYAETLKADLADTSERLKNQGKKATKQSKEDTVNGSISPGTDRGDRPQ